MAHDLAALNCWASKSGALVLCYSSTQPAPVELEAVMKLSRQEYLYDNISRMDRQVQALLSQADKLLLHCKACVLQWQRKRANEQQRLLK